MAGNIPSPFEIWLGRLIGAVLVLLFAFFFVTGVWQLAKHISLVHSGVQAPGVVVDVKAAYWGIHGTHVGSNAPEYHPVIKFKGSDGTSYTFESRQGSYPALYQVNDHVRIIYLIGHPESPKIISLMDLWFEPLIFILLGFLPALLFIKRGKNY